MPRKATRTSPRTAALTTNTASKTRARTRATPNPSRALARIAAPLKAARVATVNVKYLVEGDHVSFCFEPYNRRAKMVPASAVANGLAVEAECLHWFMALQQRRYPNWESGAGGFGVFEWNLARNTLTHYHHARKVEVKTTRHEGF